jgi:cell division initiation protein
MKITPIEIRQKTFEKVFRGYDKEEVDAFLQTLSQEWERVNGDIREHKVKLEIAEKDVNKLREMESSLFRTLKTAEDSNNNLLEQSKKEVELKVKEAQLNAEEILADARTQAKAIIQKAEYKARITMQELLGEMKNLERDYKMLESQRENLSQEMRNMMLSVLEKLSRNDTKTAQTDFSEKIKHVQNTITEEEEKAETKRTSERLSDENLRTELKTNRTEYNNSFFDNI